MKSYFGSYSPSPSPNWMFTLYFSLCAITLWLIQYPPLPLSSPTLTPHPLSMCPSNLLGLAESLLSASLLTVEPFDFLKRQLRSYAEAFSSSLFFSMCASTVYTHTHAQEEKCMKNKYMNHTSISFWHDACSITGKVEFLFFCFMLSAQTVDSVLVQQSVIVTAKI